MDLSIITDGWTYDEEDEAENVRKVVGIDGADKVQVRIRNGLLQWEMDGRPDGTRPHDCPSMLEHCRRLREEGDLDELTVEAVEELVQELFDYYQRSQALFHLGDFSRVLADLEHCLGVLGILRDSVPQESFQFEQYRPGLLVDKARAGMLLEVQNGDLREAFVALNEGIRQVEEFYLEHELDEDIPESTERQVLIELRRSLRERHNVPLNDRELLRSLRLEQELAIHYEDYEMAARLRDKINSLKHRIRAQD